MKVGLEPKLDLDGSKKGRELLLKSSWDSRIFIYIQV